jgi:hypothetical protein
MKSANELGTAMARKLFGRRSEPTLKNCRDSGQRVMREVRFHLDLTSRDGSFSALPDITRRLLGKRYGRVRRGVDILVPVCRTILHLKRDRGTLRVPAKVHRQAPEWSVPSLKQRAGSCHHLPKTLHYISPASYQCSSDDRCHLQSAVRSST